MRVIEENQAGHCSPNRQNFSKAFDTTRLAYRAPEEITRLSTTISETTPHNFVENTIAMQFGYIVDSKTKEVDNQARLRLIVGGPGKVEARETPRFLEPPSSPFGANINFKKFTIDDFEIGKKLGKGRFGDVFLAREKKTNFIVALKILRKTEINRLNAEKLIVREIKIHSFLDHKNIIKLYGFFHDADNICLILEYAPDGELYTELKNAVFLSARSTIP